MIIVEKYDEYGDTQAKTKRLTKFKGTGIALKIIMQRDNLLISMRAEPAGRDQQRLWLVPISS